METDSSVYVMGHSESEIHRLQVQAEVLQPITRRALIKANLEVGAKVLDVGCGAGDTTMLAGEIVGSSGHVLGIDRNDKVLGLARQRAAAIGATNLSFKQCSFEDLENEGSFDAVISRYVLVHQPKPTECLKRMARLTKPGGFIFCHEVSFRRGQFSYPPIPVWDNAVDHVISAFRAASSSHDAADLMARHFFDAGLSAPQLFCEIPITLDRDSLLCSWIAGTLRTLLPFVPSELIPEIEIDTLEQRMRQAIAEVHAQVEATAQVMAWLRISP